MADYVKLPEIPDECSWGTRIRRWPMYDNDKIACCTCASKGHLVLGWTDNVGRRTEPSTQAIVEAYSRISGYDPRARRRDGTNPTDTGAYALDALKDFRTNGIGEHKIELFMQVDKNNLDMVKAAIYLFGGIYCGFSLPKYIESYRPSEVWNIKNIPGQSAPGSWGGHAVSGVMYSSKWRMIGFITWGTVQWINYDFFVKYCDECYVLLSGQDWLKDDGMTPSYLNLAEARQQLARVTAS